MSARYYVLKVHAHARVMCVSGLSMSACGRWGQRWGRVLVLRSEARLKVVCPLRSIFGFDKGQQWVPSQQGEASPQMELRLDPARGVRSLHAWLCFAPASLWALVLCRLVSLSVQEGAGLTDI